jgi:hypothetical protein
MDDDIVLRGDRLALDTDAGRRFVSDMARFADGILSEQQVRRKWRLDEAVWEKLGADDSLVEAIEDEKLRRQFDGRSKRERAQQLVVKAPAILDSIASDDRASPRHRVDAIKTLDGLATNGREAAATENTRFVIRIDLTAGGGDVEVYDIPRTIESKDNEKTSGDDDDTTPQELLPAIAANKRNGGSGGQPL